MLVWLFKAHLNGLPALALDDGGAVNISPLQETGILGKGKVV
jgi:hypothetical protein